MITPLYDAYGIRLYQSDCGPVLCDLNEPVDCVISDPPYHLRRYLIALESGEEIRSADIDGAWFLRLCHWYLAWMTLAHRLVGDGPVWLFAGLEWAGVMSRAFALLQWPVQDIFGVPGQEVLIYAGKYPLTAKARRFVHDHLSEIGAPTVKPAALIETLIIASRLPPRALILDPFAGDGSTLIAAKHQGKRAIGIEYRESRCQATIDALEGA